MGSESKPQKHKEILFLSSKTRKIKVWTKEEDEILLKMAEIHENKNWKTVAASLKGRTPIQCSGRYKRIRPGIIKGVWTETDDKLLIALVGKYGKNWSLISNFITSKNGKQIRDRYVNKLDKTLAKDKFSKEDDDKLFELYSKYGRCWTKISTFFPGRTGDMIKNRFYSNIRKRLNSSGSIKCKENLKEDTVSSICSKEVLNSSTTAVYPSIHDCLDNVKSKVLIESKGSENNEGNFGREDCNIINEEGSNIQEGNFNQGNFNYENYLNIQNFAMNNNVQMNNFDYSDLMNNLSVYLNYLSHQDQNIVINRMVEIYKRKQTEALLLNLVFNSSK